MGAFGPLHWIVVAIIAILLLGGGRFSNLMGDVAKGVKNFKKGMAEEDEDAAAKPAPRIETQQPVRPAAETIVQDEKTR
ncbi:MAG: twin-arginine translocase TatA/TatE family subunit [Candidatus Sphingomonas colombiensis]|nr:twin-arginine translocase TatA/TatE family subunit [Sphingomonas sp.]WEK42063.1 MAG: twin-arginine translocase TatA/TatE family subunit [Sphingomonas sp.]